MKQKRWISTKELIVFSMLGTIMFLSKLLMEFLPNIHAIALFIAVFTLVYRQKALIPIYVYVLLTGVYGGFNLWWVPYLYIWTILWGAIMLIPKDASIKTKAIISAVLCALHGLLYGALYAPVQAIMYGLSFKGMIAWIMVGIPFDITHMIGNIVLSLLIAPLYKIIKKFA